MMTLQRLLMILLTILLALVGSHIARSLTPVLADASFVDDFEKGDVLDGGWSETIVSSGSAIDVSTLHPYAGAQAALFTLDKGMNAWLAADLAGSRKELTLSFRFRLDQTLRQSDAPLYIAGFWNETGEQIASFYYRTDTGWFQCDYVDAAGASVYGFGTAGHTLWPDRWYNMEITVKLGSAARLAWIVDDEELFSDTVSLSGISLSRLGLGQVNGDVAASGSFSIDLVRWGTGDVERLDRGRVSLGFDDGRPTCWSVIRPLLDEFGYKASFYIVTDYIIPTRSWAMSLEQVQGLAAAGHEIQSHSVDHLSLSGLSDEDLEVQISGSRSELRDWGFNPVSLAYPYGDFDDRVIKATRKEYRLGLRTGTVLNGRSHLEGGAGIWRVDAASLDLEEAKALIDDAIDRDKWLIFYLHSVGDDHPGNGNWVTNDFFRGLLQHLKDRQADVVPIERALAWPNTNALPTNRLVPLTATSGGRLTLTAVFSDPDGHGNLTSGRIQISGSTSAYKAVCLRYDVHSGLLALANNAGSFDSTGVIPGSSGLLENGQVRIAAADVSVTASGNDLSVTVPMEFTAAFKGTKRIYLENIDRNGAGSGLGQRGTFTVKPLNAPSSVTGFSPIEGSGKTATFAVKTTDVDGTQDIERIDLLIENIDGTARVELGYLPASRRILLRADNGVSWLGRTAGSYGRLRNSLASINTLYVRARPAGSTLELTVPIEFQFAFLGKKRVSVRVQDKSGNDSGWLEKGSFIVTTGK